MSRAYWMIATILSSSSAIAYDPFTLVTGAQATSRFFGGLDEAADIGVSLSEFLVEIDEDSGAQDQADAVVRRVDEFRSKVNEAQYFKGELEDTMNLDGLDAKSHAQKIKKARQIVQMIKKVSTLFGLRPKVAERAAQAQQTQLQYLMLDEMMAMRRAQFRQYLEARDGEIQRKSLLSKLEFEARSAQKNLRTQYSSRSRKP